MRRIRMFDTRARRYATLGNPEAWTLWLGIAGIAISALELYVISKG